MRFSKKIKFSAIALATFVFLTIGIAGCGSSNGGGGQSQASKDGILTVAADTGSTNQFARNFNFAGGGSVTAPGIFMFYEQLWRYSPKGEEVPVLADGKAEYKVTKYPEYEIKQYKKDLEKSIKESIKNKEPGFETKALVDKYRKGRLEGLENGKNGIFTETIHLKKNIKWSDGVPFTAKDVVFRLMDWNGSGFCDSINDCFLQKAPYATDDYTVKIEFNGIYYRDFQDVIVPEHIYKNAPSEMAINGNPNDPNNHKKIKHYQLDKYVDKNPVGTGPGKLISFSGQKIRVGWRDDYYGGKTSGVKEIDFVPQGTAAKAQASVTRGDVDWSEGAINNVEKVFVSKSENNHYTYFPTGGSRGVLFNFGLAPTNDLAVRKALRDSVDLTVGQKAADIGYQIPSITGLAPEVTADYLLPEYSKPITPNVEQAKNDLSSAGWTVNSSGNLEKDGKEYPLTLWYSTTERPEDMVILPTIIDQWKKNLGIIVGNHPTADTPYQAGKEKHQYQLFTDNAASYAITPASAWASYSQYNLQRNWGSKGLYKVSNDTDKLIMTVANSPFTDKEDMAKIAKEIQTGITKDAPYLPYEELGVGIMYSSRNWTNWPTINSEWFPYLMTYGGNNNFVSVVQMLKPAQ